MSFVIEEERERRANSEAQYDVLAYASRRVAQAMDRLKKLDAEELSTYEDHTELTSAIFSVLAAVSAVPAPPGQSKTPRDVVVDSLIRWCHATLADIAIRAEIHYAEHNVGPTSGAPATDVPRILGNYLRALLSFKHPMAFDRAPAEFAEWANDPDAGPESLPVFGKYWHRGEP